jgi:hypothetical protein
VINRDHSLGTTIREIHEDSRILGILLLGAVIGGVDATKNVIRESSEGRLYGLVYICLILGLIVFIFLRKYFRKAKPLPPKRGEYFYGLFSPAIFGRDEKIDRVVWPRSKDERRIENAIRNCASRGGDYLILVGQSGVGKSTIIKGRVTNALKPNWRVLTVDEYGDDFRDRFCEELSVICPEAEFDRVELRTSGKLKGKKIDGHLLVFFDQFEQFLLQAKKTSKPSSDLDWFRLVAASLHQHPAIVPLVAVRREWFYELRFLREKVPSPLRVIHLGGVPLDFEDELCEEVRAKFCVVAGDDSISKLIIEDLGSEGEIQPVEVQIVGQMIEDKLGTGKKLTRKIYWERWGGKEGLLQEFLRRSLYAAPNTTAAAEVVFALSAEKSHRHPLAVPEISRIIHKSEALVEESVEYFVKLGLVRRSGKDVVELSHDYLAEKFYTFSGANLPAADRDNILFFWHATTSNVQLQDPIIPDEQKKGIVFSNYVYYFLLTVLLARLFAPAIGPRVGLDWQVYNPLKAFQQTVGIIDIFYFPVFISHLGWTFYVCRLYQNLLYHLKHVETATERCFSVISVILCALCVLVAVVVPPIFMLSIGLGGLGVAVRFWLLSRRSHLPSNASSYFYDIAKSTLFNCLGACIVGAVMLYYAVVYPNENHKLLTTLFLAAGVGLALVVFSVLKAHTTPKAAATMAGFLDRGRSLTVNKHINRPAAA